MVQKVVDTLLDVPPWIALLIIVAVVFGEAALLFGFVLPGETAVVYGGVLADAGKVSVVLVLALVVVAAVAGDSVGFEVGRALGPRLVRAPVLRNHVERVELAQAYLRRRGGRAVVMGRFTAFLRAVMPGLAGASRMEYRRFLVFNVIGGVIWATACVLLGFFAAHSIGRITHALGVTSAVIVVVIVVGVLWAWHRRSREA
ncbi:MAG TPA: DedA family protein [Nocardioides sp.]|jgi:membrane protein DedA with SNARE-associated domain|uniref:DedA family protein n=1 Tax=Nocardioides sp. TaxID=35761 RepID=UPI002E3304B4|nr:DedA family protein [Nocardioides sp.]HEX3929831.1 DedA family protein [Nocardioides sp.]